jgi:hypothetical protein
MRKNGGRKRKKHRTFNIERPTSNIEWEELTNRNSHPRFDIRFWKTIEIEIEERSDHAKAWFNVGSSMFDVNLLILIRM